MKTLYVLFDGECALCHRCRRWLERQPAYVELRFRPAAIPGGRLPVSGDCAVPPGGATRWPSADAGDVYQGSHAWIMCLWALREYREWSQRLASPALLPWARRVCELVSENRLTLSAWFRKGRQARSARNWSGGPEAARIYANAMLFREPVCVSLLHAS